MFAIFGLGRSPQAQGPPKTQRSDPKYRDTHILSPNSCHNRFWIRSSPFSIIFPETETSSQKNKAISTTRQAKNQTTGTERRVLKSYHPSFQFQSKRCHQRRDMLTSVINHRFLLKSGVPCFGSCSDQSDCICGPFLDDF